MTKEDRARLRDTVDAEAWVPKIDDLKWDDTLTEDVEVREGCPGRVLHRCYHRWNAVGMWMIARMVEQPRAIAELAYEHGFLMEPAYRQLLQSIGEKEDRTRDPGLPEWDRDEQTLNFEGEPIRKIRSLAVARNIVAILDAFEIDSWCSRIDAPGQLSGQTLHDAVYTLNEGLKSIRFHVAGDGNQIRWARHD
jgi:hypothetical protein